MGLKTLRKPWQFQKVYRDGRKLVCRHAVVYYHHPTEGECGPLVAIVAGKRVGGAVLRNRAKRLLRDVISQSVNRFTQRRVWLVVVAKPDILGSAYCDIRIDLQTRLRDEGLLINDTSTE